MKKKILFGLLAALIILSLSIVPAFAKSNSVLCISEDYSYITYNGSKYLRLDRVHIMLGYDYSNIYNTDLTQAQENEILSVYAYDHGDFINVDIMFIKGGSASYVYVKEDAQAHYREFLNGSVQEFQITEYFIGIDVLTTKDAIMENPITLKGYEVNYYSIYADVYHISDEYRKFGGYILSDGDHYYYLDIYQFGPDNAIEFNASKFETVTIHKITDSALIADISSDSDRTDVSIGYDDAVALTLITGIVITLFLGVAPLVAFILCLVFSAKAKKPYRSILRTVAILLAIELVAFISMAIWLITLI